MPITPLIRGLAALAIGGSLLALPANVATAASGGPVTLYAAPNGSGEACSESAPCSLSGAQQRVRTLNKDMSSDIVVELAGGTYRLDRTWAFTADDSGMNGHQVIWRAAPGRHPVISGGKQITGWQLRDPARGIWAADVPASFNTRQLYVDGVRAPVAQGAPPVQLTRTSTGYEAASDALSHWRNPSGLEFVYSGPEGTGAWTESRCRVAGIDGTAITMQQPCWSNVTDRKQPPAQNPYYFPNLPGNAVPNRIEDAYELIHPGQWYLDPNANKVYYMPSAGHDPRRADVEAPVLQDLVTGTGTLDAPVHNIVMTGLQFSYATWLDPSGPNGFSEIQTNIRVTGDNSVTPQGTCNLTQPPGTCPYGAYAREPGNVTWHAAQHILIQGDTFTHLGAAGLVFEYGSSDNVIEGNLFTDISGIGVELGNTNDPHPSDVGADNREINAFNRIDNNVIRDIGVEYPGADGIFLLFSQHTTVAHNEISDVPWDGIDSGANGGHVDTASQPDVTTNINAHNVISDNLIYDFKNVLSDGGAIYLEGHQGATIKNPNGSVNEGASFAEGTTVSGNIAYNQGFDFWALYDDIGSQWITWKNNIEWGAPGGNGGCASVGHIRFTNNYTSEPVSQFPCSPMSIDLNYSNNTQVPDQPTAADLPAGTLATTGLQPPFQQLTANAEPRVTYLNPHTGTASAPTRVLIAGSGFTPATQVSWSGIAASAVQVLSSNFIIATAPAGTPLALVTVRTPGGTITAPSATPISDAYNISGISDDTAPQAADFNGVGYSYSAQALAQAGVTPGSTVSANGVNFTWPGSQPDQPDAVLARGQAIQVSGSGSTLGLLLATDDYNPASGTATVIYADGTQQAAQIEAGVWSSQTPGLPVAIDSPYLNYADQAHIGNQGYVYFAGIPLQHGKTVKEVVLPFTKYPHVEGNGPGNILVFGVGVG